MKYSYSCMVVWRHFKPAVRSPGVADSPAPAEESPAPVDEVPAPAEETPPEEAPVSAGAGSLAVRLKLRGVLGREGSGRCRTNRDGPFREKRTLLLHYTLLHNYTPTPPYHHTTTPPHHHTTITTTLLHYYSTTLQHYND